jgi:hypothetical protein
MARPPTHHSRGELMSDRDPANAAAVEMPDGSIHYVAPSSIPDQLGIRTELHVPTPRGRSESSEANSNSRQYSSNGAANTPGPHNKPGK